MKIKLSTHRGFCFGVRRGVKLAEKALAEFKNNRVYTIGPLIHNPQVVERLKKNGLVVISDLSGVKKGTIIISCHGTTPQVMEKIRHKGLRLLDATCPFVKRPQLIARSLKKQGYFVVIVGDKKHTEVRSLSSFAGKNSAVVSTPEEARRFRVKPGKLGVIAQTTQSAEVFNSIVAQLLQKGLFETRIFNTICDDAAKRQEKALELAKKADVMLVVGGKNSANTKRLAMVCKKACGSVYHIETQKELKPVWVRGKKTVGMTSGASTPDWVVEEVVKKMKEKGE